MFVIARRSEGPTQQSVLTSSSLPCEREVARAQPVTEGFRPQESCPRNGIPQSASLTASPILFVPSGHFPLIRGIGLSQGGQGTGVTDCHVGPLGLPIPFVPSGHFPLTRGIGLSQGGQGTWITDSHVAALLGMTVTSYACPIILAQPAVKKSFSSSR